MLSAAEAGELLKRYVRAAAALNALYDDTALAAAMQINRGAVAGWWMGAQMKPDTLGRLAAITGLSPDELSRFVYFDGPVPTLPDPALLPVLEGIRRDRERPVDEAPDESPPQPARRPRDTGAGRE